MMPAVLQGWRGQDPEEPMRQGLISAENPRDVDIFHETKHTMKTPSPIEKSKTNHTSPVLYPSAIVQPSIRQM